MFPLLNGCANYDYNSRITNAVSVKLSQNKFVSTEPSTWINYVYPSQHAQNVFVANSIAH